MPVIRVQKEDLNDPWESERTLIRVEDAAWCDGSECGELFFDGYGQPLEPGPHHHTVASGENPSASPRRYAIFAN